MHGNWTKHCSIITSDTEHNFYWTVGKFKTVFSPPYALKTFLCLRLSLGLSQGLVGVMPLSLMPVIGHLGTDGRFLRYWNTSFPPGVLMILRRLDRVLYDNRRRYVTRWTIWKRFKLELMLQLQSGDRTQSLDLAGKKPIRWLKLI